MKIKFDQDRTETIIVLTRTDIFQLQDGDALNGAGIVVSLDASALEAFNECDARLDEMNVQLHECEATVAMIGVGDDAPSIPLARVLEQES